MDVRVATRRPRLVASSRESIGYFSYQLVCGEVWSCLCFRETQICSATRRYHITGCLTVQVSDGDSRLEVDSENIQAARCAADERPNLRKNTRLRISRAVKNA